MNEQDTSDLSRLREASEWVQRLHASTDASLSDEWLQWCQADSRNLPAFERVQEVWEGFGSADTAIAHSPRVVRRAVAACIALALLAAAALAGYSWRHSLTDTLSTNRAEQRHQMLADGSRLELGPMSRLRLDFTQEHREIWLEGGHVFFAVTHDRSRPFVVHAGGLSITAIGTEFDVRDATRDVTVTVSDGHINVSADGKRPGSPSQPSPEFVQAAAGERVTFSKSMDRLSLASVDLELAESWRNGVLQFVGEPLDEVIAEVTLYSARPIVLGDSELRKLRFTGTVSQAHIDHWLAALEEVFPVQIIDRGPGGILIRAASVPKVSSHEGT